MKGIVKWFSGKRGYGFVMGEDQKEYFAHYSEIVTNKKYKNLPPDVEVEFEPSSNDKGATATNIKIIKAVEA